MLSSRKGAAVVILVHLFIASVIPINAQEATDAEPTEEMQIRTRWEQINQSVMEIPFENILEPDEELVTDGSVNYVPRLQELMNQESANYKADGILRVIKFPAGTFTFPVENASVESVSGVGFRGAGKIDNPGDGPDTYLTVLKPARTALSSNSTYSSDQVHEDVVIDCIEIDCSDQVIVPELSTFFYAYKALYVQRVSNWWMNDVYAHDSLGTLFGLDYVYEGGIYHIDCYAKGSGRNIGSGSAPSNESSPGAGFGITCGQFEDEQVKFVGCVAQDCTTGGFYLEIRSKKVETPRGYSILNSKAFGCAFGVNDQGVSDLVIEDCEFFNNTAYGIRRGAVDTGDVYGASKNGAGSKGVPGSMYCRRTKIYGNGGANNNLTVRSAGVIFAEKFQVAGINENCEQVFEDCEIFNNRGYGIANSFSVPRFLKLTGTTKIYSNGGSGMHFRQGVNPLEVITITTEGDNVEIFNNGACGDSRFHINGNHTTGVFGDAVTLSVNSEGNNMKFKAYGNKGRALAHRRYLGKADFTITNSVYAGDWTGQTNGNPYNNEAGATNIKILAQTAPHQETEQYINYANNGNGNIEGDTSRNIGTINNPNPVPTVSRESNLEDGDHFQMIFPGTSGNSRNLFVILTNNTPSGLVPQSTMVMSSVWVKVNKNGIIRANGNSTQGTVATEYKDNDPFARTTVTANQWVRVDYANASVASNTSPHFGIAFIDTETTTDTIIQVRNIMCLSRPDSIDYFDGATNGGTWLGTPYRSASEKYVETPDETLVPDEFEIDENGVLIKYNGEQQEVIVPQNVNAIGERAFYGTLVTLVTMNEGVERIAAEAFAECPSLVRVRIPFSTAFIAPNAFDKDSGVQLEVFEGSYALEFAIEHELDYVSLPLYPVWIAAEPTCEDEAITAESLATLEQVTVELGMLQGEQAEAVLLIAFYGGEGDIVALGKTAPIIGLNTVDINGTPLGATRMKILCWSGMDSMDILMECYQQTFAAMPLEE